MKSIPDSDCSVIRTAALVCTGCGLFLYVSITVLLHEFFLKISPFFWMKQGDQRVLGDEAAILAYQRNGRDAVGPYLQRVEIAFMHQVQKDSWNYCQLGLVAYRAKQALFLKFCEECCNNL